VLPAGFHAKPIGLLNVEGFYDPLLSFFDHCVAEVRQSALHSSSHSITAPTVMIGTIIGTATAKSNVLLENICQLSSCIAVKIIVHIILQRTSFAWRALQLLSSTFDVGLADTNSHHNGCWLL
jgi:hypothetical protein